MWLVFREYPCEFDSLFVLCQMLAADADSGVSIPALELLHLLRRQFLDDSLTVSHSQTGMHNFCTNQIDICRLLAKTYPKITMSIFSGNLLEYLHFCFFFFFCEYLEHLSGEHLFCEFGNIFLGTSFLRIFGTQLLEHLSFFQTCSAVPWKDVDICAFV